MDENYFYRLILADGTVLMNCECGLYENTIGCTVRDLSIADAVVHFLNPTNFETIIFDIVYSMGYTDRFEYSGIEKLSSIAQREHHVDVYLEGTNIIEKKSRIYNQETEVVDE